MAYERGQWYGKRRYYGLHYDLHAGPHDTELGTRATPEQLVPMLKLMGCQFVQTDCKGHAGYTSWRSRTPTASISPGVRRDALKGWRAATRELGLPLHCHYSGIWDRIAGKKHPNWCVIGPEGRPAGGAFGSTKDKPTGEKMCPRGPYLDKLMIPQLIELIDEWGVDGFWIDGDIWAVEPCYCKRCRKAFAAQTGIGEPPVDRDDAHWVAWMDFTRQGFYDYVTRYCDAVHAHKPTVKVCSNWLQTFKNPGEPSVPTDWISGDNIWVYGLDGCRCEARFISTRGKPWDIMIWAFFKSAEMAQRDTPWNPKPVQMLQQEAAVVVAFGGNVQIYESPHGLRNGQLVPWRMKRLREVGRFVKARRRLCQDTVTFPQVAVLHSEHHLHSQPAPDLQWGLDTTPVRGAVHSLLECHYGVDVMDEWALLPRLGEFPVVVAPEQDDMSDEAVAALKDYVRAGGRLLVSGAAALGRFGARFLGVRAGKLEEAVTYHVPAGDGAVAVHSSRWQMVTSGSAEPIGRLGRTSLLDDRLLPSPAATINRVGKGRVVYVPFDVFGYFEQRRFAGVRQFIGQVAAKLAGRLAIRVSAPTCVDVALRTRDGRTIVHLVNRASGIPNLPNDGTVDEIPEVGPVTIEIDLPVRPKSVELAWEDGGLDWRWKRKRQGGTLTAIVAKVHIHAAVVVG